MYVLSDMLKEPQPVVSVLSNPKKPQLRIKSLIIFFMSCQLFKHYLPNQPFIIIILLCLFNFNIKRHLIRPTGKPVNHK